MAPEASGTRGAGFTLLDPERTGVSFTNILAGDAYATNAVAHNGSGVAAGDVDGDGRVDVYWCRLDGANELYRNLGGWRFERIDAGEAACAGQLSTGAALVDVDGDGDLDLLVNGIRAGTRLFLNDGRGHWMERRDAGLSSMATATSMALADIDGDGDLDLYCTHYIDHMHLTDPTTRFGMGQRDGRWYVARVNDVPTTHPRYQNRFEVLQDGEVREIPEADALYRNDGGGRFTAIQDEPGVFADARGRPIKPPRDWGLAVVFRDLDGDGAPDLYVSNDYASPDRLWFNDGRGRFRLADSLRQRHWAYNAMGVDVADVDRDGWDDLVVMDLLATEHGRRMRQTGKTPPDPLEQAGIDGRPQFNRNMLYLGRPGGRFVETALASGIAASEWSWTPVFLDVDLDGYEDLLVANGFGFDLMDQDTQERLQRSSKNTGRVDAKRWMTSYPEWRSSCLAFRNRGDGTFEPKSRDWGFDANGLSFGMALADLDDDGDLDVLVNRLNAPAAVYRNDASRPRVSVRLHGIPPNTSGIGARIRLLGPPVNQSQEMMGAGRYLSSDQSLRAFAIDDPGLAGSTIEVRWRNGAVTTVTNVQPNHGYEIHEALTSPAPPLSRPRIVQLFSDATASLKLKPTALPPDDPALQPMVARRVGGLGAPLAWFDIDGDGWDDLIVGGSPGVGLALLHNEQGRGFELLSGDPGPGERAILGWPDGRGTRRWLTLLPSDPSGAPTRGGLQVHAGIDTSAQHFVGVDVGALATLAAGDLDGDGDLDVFAGGHAALGRYPEPVRSTCWRNREGVLGRDANWEASLSGPGLVAGAVIADLDGDGDLDVALAVEWGPVRVFRNHGGVFQDATAALGLLERRGWWSGLAAGDFDGDGRVDLAVGNVGRNTGYALFGPGPIRLYHGDWAGTGRTANIEAWMSGDRWLPIRNRRQLAPCLPDLAARVPTDEAFSRLGIPEILGDRVSTAPFLEVNTVDSGILLNRGSRFEWRPLPREAQLAPVLSVNVGDMDGDGAQDLFLSQNRSDLLPELSRDDSGRGLWLRGLGDGRFESLDPAVTGIDLPGEQRAAALGDFNRDGRVDLAVVLANGPTRLFVNRSPQRGLRVVLQDPPGNPDGIGAQVRLRFSEGRLGPMHVVQAGSGFGAHDSPAIILGGAGQASAVEVHWPGGQVQSAPVPGGATEVHVRRDTARSPRASRP